MRLEFIDFIGNRMSLRQPLRDSLNIVAKIVEDLDVKAADDPSVLQSELARIRALYPTCVDFERDFVSVAFSIATGVGKTRLMGAIMTYLFLEGKSRNFFVLAPNLTIYEKLIKDFGDPSFEKYVFKGISELANHPPVVITGDNYSQASTLFAAVEMRINVFNISKFNKETTEGSSKKGGFGLPRIKRISEYLGQSYWSYLSGLNDLVILMDEAHRYHADKSKKAINELKPMLGIELTATPYVNNDKEKGEMFKNIVFEYSLGKALHEGKYIKKPAIATRENFKAKDHNEEEIERIKLEDAISVHEKTKLELQRYALESGRKEVKPFILVVCRDTTHAKAVHDYVISSQFFNGQYANKALQIDSTTRTTDDIEKLFIGLENPKNPIEIVIHVNMLKEGWDVSNLYTIVPLRASKALILIEQTIGRGLRLPYGERTGDSAVDTLTVLSHEHFDQVIEASKNESSIFKKMEHVVLKQVEIEGKRELVVVADTMSQAVKDREARIAVMQEGTAKQKEQHILSATRAIINVLPQVSAKMPTVRSFDDLTKKEGAKEIVKELIREEAAKSGNTLFKEQETVAILQEVDVIYETVVTDYRKNRIEIPRLTVLPTTSEAQFDDFDLDTSVSTVESKFEFHVSDELIVREDLIEHNKDYIGVMLGARNKSGETPAQMIVADLIIYPEVEYDKFHKLLFKLANQAIVAIKQTIRENETIERIVSIHRRLIARRIYFQMKNHFHLTESGYEASEVMPFSKIYEWNITLPLSAGRLDVRNDSYIKAHIKKYIFMGFKKSSHAQYPFDSSSEADFSIVLEDDKIVETWMRPAPNQFEIYWEHQTKKYEPDFVVETKDIIYLVEVKASNELQDREVLEKAKAAKKYCDEVSKYLTKHNKKPWKYFVIPHDVIKRNLKPYKINCLK